MVQVEGDALALRRFSWQPGGKASSGTSQLYLIEFGPTADLFTRPKLSETEAYVTGRFG